MLFIERAGLKSAAPELSLPQAAMAGIEPAGFPNRTGKPANYVWHEHGMNVIGHEAEGTKLHLIAHAIEPEQLLIAAIVRLIPKQDGARLGAMDRVMGDTGHHDACKSRHPQPCPKRACQ